MSSDPTIHESRNADPESRNAEPPIVSATEHATLELVTLQRRLAEAKQRARYALQVQRRAVAAAKMRVRRAQSDDRELQALDRYDIEVQILRDQTEAVRTKLLPLRNQIRLARLKVKACRKSDTSSGIAAVIERARQDNE